jgi:hypothetical protein
MTERLSRRGMVCIVLALFFVVVAVLCVGAFGITELYADQWRHYLSYVNRPFVAAVFSADNGHRSVLPGFIKVIELRWLNGNQLLQLGLGMVFALGAVAVFSNLAWRDRSHPSFHRLLSVALFSFAVLWLGNARMLAHGNESINIYPIIFALACSAFLLAGRASVGAGRLVAAILLAVAAAFSFGSGIAVFLAIVMILFIDRHYTCAAIASISFILTLALYIWLPNDAGVRNTIEFNPILNLHTMATWISSMWIQLFGLQVDSGNSLPGGLRDGAKLIAFLYASVFGSPKVNTLPLALVGYAGIFVLLWMTWKSWARTIPISPLRVAALGICWFALGVGALVAISRMSYFNDHPGQIFANRYVAWSCLFWIGLLVASLTTQPVRKIGYLLQKSVVALSFGILGMGVITTYGYAVWAKGVKERVQLTSTSFVSSVIDPTLDPGETVYEEVAESIDLIKKAKVAAFSWPEALLIGEAVGRIEPQPEASIDLSVIPFDNLLGGRAMKLDLAISSLYNGQLPARLLIAAEGVYIGVMIRNDSNAERRYRGYAVGDVEAQSLSAIGLDEDDDRKFCYWNC